MFSISMSIADFFPVCLFGLGAYLLQKDLYNKMSKGAYALLCAGTIDVFMAGFLKATYKLLYALNICAFEPLNTMFFPVQAIGLVLCGVSIISMLTLKQGPGKMYALATPVLYKGTLIFVIFMIFGVVSLNTGLSIIAKRMNKKTTIILFAFSCMCLLMMGYLSSKDFTDSTFNWIAEGINVCGQLSFFIGIKILDKAGLKDFNL